MGLFTTNPVFDMLKKDHKKVEGLFDEFEAAEDARSKTRIIQETLRELEVHAQLEEEVFYPALRAARPTAIALDKSVPQHNEMRESIAKLRTMAADTPAYDDTVMELMREVIHHVADEETILLPMAEDVLAADLRKLGTQMNLRRLQLVAHRPTEIAINSVGAFPILTFSVAGLATLAVLTISRTLSRTPRGMR